MRRWLQRAALAGVCLAVTVIAWVGYHAGDAQAAWTALWSLCGLAS